MKYFFNNDSLKHPWENVVSAFWQRYPNPYSKHVLSEDTCFREINEKNGVLKSKRLLTKTNPIPKWGRKLVNVRHVAVAEESLVDLKNRIFTTYTRNVGLLGYMTVDEKVTYLPDEKNPGCTIIRREAWINSQMRGISTLVTRFALERYKHNATNATKGFLLVLSRLYPGVSKDFAADHKHLGGIKDIMTSRIGKVKQVGERLSPKEVL